MTGHFFGSPFPPTDLMPALQGAGLGMWSNHWRALNQWGPDAESRMQGTSCVHAGDLGCLESEARNAENEEKRWRGVTLPYPLLSLRGQSRCLLRHLAAAPRKCRADSASLLACGRANVPAGELGGAQLGEPGLHGPERVTSLDSGEPHTLTKPRDLVSYGNHCGRHSLRPCGALGA